MGRLVRLLAVLAAVVLVAASCGDSDDDATDTTGELGLQAPTTTGADDAPPDETLPDEAEIEGEADGLLATMAETGVHTQLVSLIGIAGLTDVLNEGAYTVFAPTDAAFATLGDEALAALEQDSETLGRILSHHVVEGELVIEDLVAMSPVTTLAGTELRISAEGDDGAVEDVPVVESDVQSTDGMIHVIDEVLLPADVSLDLLGGVEDGDTGTSDEAPATTLADPPATDAVDEDAAEAADDVIATLEATGMHTELLLAIAEAELTEAVMDAEVTVFAPTDAAFEALGEDALAELLDDTERLRRVLEHHLVGGDHTIEELVAMSPVSTVAVTELTVTAEGDDGTVEGVPIVESDLATTDGMIHVIDEVLLPPEQS